MTDLLFLKAIRARASKRLGNFGFITIIDELIRQTGEVEVLEGDIMDRFSKVCQLYTELDEDDVGHIGIPRPNKVEDPDRIRRLDRAGLYISRSDDLELGNAKNQEATKR